MKFLRRILPWGNNSDRVSHRYVLMRSRYQPLTVHHIEAVKNFFSRVAPEVKEKFGGKEPILVLAIVRNLLRGTSLGTYVEDKIRKNPESALANYKERFKPQLNPLHTCEIMDDINVALSKALSKKQRDKVMVTVMPEFACTVHMLKDSALESVDRDLLYDFLPEECSWAIPVFDGDDETDVEFAKSKGGDVYRIPVECPDLGDSQYGLYYNATEWLLRDDRAHLAKIMPAEVLRHWQAAGTFRAIQDRISAPADGQSWQEAFASLNDNSGVKCFDRKRDGSGEQTAAAKDNSYRLEAEFAEVSNNIRR